MGCGKFRADYYTLKLLKTILPQRTTYLFCNSSFVKVQTMTRYCDWPTCRTPVARRKSWATAAWLQRDIPADRVSAPCTLGRARRPPLPPAQSPPRPPATAAPRYTARSLRSSSACSPPPKAPRSVATALPRTPARCNGCSPPPSQRRVVTFTLTHRNHSRQNLSSPTQIFKLYALPFISTDSRSARRVCHIVSHRCNLCFLLECFLEWLMSTVWNNTFM